MPAPLSAMRLADAVMPSATKRASLGSKLQALK